MSDFSSSSSNARRSLAAGLLTGVCLLAVIVLARRVSGAASALESGAVACWVGAVGMLIGALSALAVWTEKPDADWTKLTWRIACCSIPGYLLGLALLPTSSAAGLSALFATFMLVTIATGSFVGQSPEAALSVDQPVTLQAIQPKASISESLPTIAPIQRQSATSDSVAMITAPLAVLPDSNAIDIEACELEADDKEELPSHPSHDPQVLHWTARSNRDGCEVVEGAIKVRFDVGMKQVAVHLPFAPAFGSMPEFEAEPLHGADDDASEVTVSIHALHAYGVRLEATRRGRLDRNEVIEIGYLASAPLADARAA